MNLQFKSGNVTSQHDLTNSRIDKNQPDSLVVYITAKLLLTSVLFNKISTDLY